MRFGLLGFLALALFFSCSSDQKKQAPLFDNLGTLNFPITTKSEVAQNILTRVLFWPTDSITKRHSRSFEEVARLDSNCAMAYWGMAYVLGPNINLPMDAGVVHTAYEAIQKAISLLDNETQREKDYVTALSKRYSAEALEDRTTLDQAYSDAMRNLSAKYPEDLDAATMFAESIMDLHPWDYWLKDGTAQAWTPELVAILEGVIQKKP